MDASSPELVSIESRVICPLEASSIHSIQALLVLTQIRAEIPNVSLGGLKTCLLEIIFALL